MTTHTPSSYTTDNWKLPRSQRPAPLSLFIATGGQRALLAALLTAGIWTLAFTAVG
ncbi:hypothetical protein ABMA57_08870 [Saccharospirillum sp. HFRX-1]|uniref:hypothetical protein n=1 Tax=unclassified Saccharospirillum TaxID=2633430 RepID=UPI00371B9083